ncbi:MAG TPA: cytochrome c maturation protein CcmE [Aggregatilineaceae bacterium]|nr:cytochrome c maturation protein CcmE [Aggregatilineaceae bacterium]
MAQPTDRAVWEKIGESAVPVQSGTRWKFVIGSMVIFGAIVFLIISQNVSDTSYYMTVGKLLSDKQYVGQTVRVSGVVIGGTIKYDSARLLIEFQIADIPEESDNQAIAIHRAANDPNAVRLSVRVENQAKPDLLKQEAQAILTGKLDSAGIFHASELLLKCPIRFQDANSDGPPSSPPAAK